MNSSLKLPLALTVLGFGAASSFADIKLNDNLSITGFLDMSTVYDDETEDFGASFDQLEVDFLLNFEGGISARADINTMGAAGGAVFEQGFLTYSNNGVGITVGKFLSASGFEAAEPTGLYQYSYSNTLVYGGYQNGLALSYGTDKYAFYASAVTSVWDEAETDFSTPGFEGQVSLMPVEGVTAKVGYFHEVIDTTDHANQGLANAWVSYAKGPITVAGEYNYLNGWEEDDVTGNGWIGMVNYAITDKIAATVRYSGLKMEDADARTEVTFSPSYALSDNWFLLAEVKRQIDDEVTNFAAESLFSF